MDVSSSSGQGGNPKRESEKLALELLSCLIQLLELRELPVTDEQWASSVALCCILLEVEKSTTVQQAAKSTLHQVLGLLFEAPSNMAMETWNDLNLLASGKEATRGAFVSQTISPQTSLELAHILLSQQESSCWLMNDASLLEPTFAVAQSHISSQDNASLETLWRSFQLSKVLLSFQQNADLIATLVHGIVVATEACRQHDDFEDGYVYEGIPLNNKKQKPLQTLIPNYTLWKAGLALETLFGILPQLQPQDASVVAESISDFCTICASCQNHVLQLIECADSKHWKDEPDVIHIEPTMFHGIEEAIKAEKTFDNSSVASGSKNAGNNMGEALWIALHCILRLCKSLDAESFTMDGCFAPALAVFQHYLKRFPGSNIIVRCSLDGYLCLADVAVPIQGGNALLRQALLASLCKLSLPSWGKHDPSWYVSFL